MWNVSYAGWEVLNNGNITKIHAEYVISTCISALVGLCKAAGIMLIGRSGVDTSRIGDGATARAGDTIGHEGAGERGDGAASPPPPRRRRGSPPRLVPRSIARERRHPRRAGREDASCASAAEVCCVAPWGRLPSLTTTSSELHPHGRRRAWDCASRCLENCPPLFDACACRLESTQIRKSVDTRTRTQQRPNEDRTTRASTVGSNIRRTQSFAGGANDHPRVHTHPTPGALHGQPP